MNTYCSEPIQLQLYRKKTHGDLSTYYLPEEQRAFTASPVKALSACKLDQERTPIVITRGNDPVGFFVLHYGGNIKPYSENPDAILLRAFSIDYHHQRKGYARSALRQLPDFVRHHFPFIKEIVLAVNFNNLTAKSLYEKMGYKEMGIREGKKGLQYLMHLTL